MGIDRLWPVGGLGVVVAISVAGMLHGGAAAVASPASRGCTAPDVRGFVVDYAQDVLSEAHCRLGVVRSQRRSHRGLVIVSQTPAPGGHAAGRRVSVTLGHYTPPRGCTGGRFQLLAQTRSLYVWQDAVGDPLSYRLPQAAEARDPRLALRACLRPAGRPFTLWELNDREVAIQDSGGYRDVQASGSVVGLVEWQADQYTNVETLTVLRVLPASRCPHRRPCAEQVDGVGVEGGGINGSPPGTLFGGVDRYVLDPGGDVAWLGRVGARADLFLMTPKRKQPWLVELADTPVTNLALASGNLTWTSGGQPHSTPAAEPGVGGELLETAEGAGLAWIQRSGAIESLYLWPSTASAPELIATAPELSNLHFTFPQLGSSSGAMLTWTAGGVAHSVAVP
jgi:hypothetical protein